jgi:transcriptional regulator with XRE-family HTH domain
MNDHKKRSVDPSIGLRIMKVRIHRRISQQQLADAIKTSVGTIQHYEHGRCDISTTLLKQIALVLECEAADLVALPEAPMPPRKSKTLRTVAHNCWDSIVSAYLKIRDEDRMQLLFSRHVYIDAQGPPRRILITNYNSLLFKLTDDPGKAA